MPTLPADLPAPVLPSPNPPDPAALVAAVSQRLLEGRPFPVPAVTAPSELLVDQHRNVFLPLSTGLAVVLTLPFLRQVLSDRAILRPDFGELLERALGFLSPGTRASVVAELVVAGKITGPQAAAVMDWR